MSDRKALSSSLFRREWETVPFELQYSIIPSVSELEALFPQTRFFNALQLMEHRIGQNTRVYGQKHVNSPVLDRSLAYECSVCTSIVIGPPKIIDSTQNEREYTVYCASCDSVLQQCKAQ